MNLKNIFSSLILINVIISMIACNNLISPRESTEPIEKVSPTKKLK